MHESSRVLSSTDLFCAIPVPPASKLDCMRWHAFGHEFRAFTGLTPTRYVEVRRRFLREHPGHALDSWPLPAD